MAMPFLPLSKNFEYSLIMVTIQPDVAKSINAHSLKVSVFEAILKNEKR